MSSNTRLSAALFLVLLLVVSACSYAPRKPYVPGRMPMAGRSVTVQDGDTVYSLARENNVAMRDVIALNKMKPPFTLNVGSRIVLPATGMSDAFDDATEAGLTPSAAPREPVQTQELPAMNAPVTSEPLSDKQSRAGPQPLVPASPPMTDKGVPAAMQEEDSTRVLYADAAPPPVKPTPPALSTPGKTTAPAKPEAVEAPPEKDIKAAEKPVAEKPVAEKPGAAPKLSWPVEGTILSRFGTRPDGSNNDGINIAAPRGTPVAAAGSGTVVYTGSDIPGFGEVVLVRHAGGWISTYGHLDRIFVEKDNVVAAGDVLGTVGTSGGLSTPQLHFGVRSGNTPKDPMAYLSKK